MQLHVLVPRVIRNQWGPRQTLGFRKVVREWCVTYGVGARAFEVGVGVEDVVRVVDSVEYHVQVYVSKVAAGV